MSSCSFDSKQLDRVRRLLAIAEDPATDPKAAEVHTAKGDGTARQVRHRRRPPPRLRRPARSRRRPPHRPARPVCAGEGLPLQRRRRAAALQAHRDHHPTRHGAAPRPHLRVHRRPRPRPHALHLAAPPAGNRVDRGSRSGEGRVEGRVQAVVLQRVRCGREGAAPRDRGARPHCSSRSGRWAGTDLVLADRNRVVAAEFKTAYPDTRSSGRRRLSGTGRDAGRAARQRADLGGARLASGRRAIGS
jgi:hypothetical protein